MAPSTDMALHKMSVWLSYVSFSGLKVFVPKKILVIVNVVLEVGLTAGIEGQNYFTVEQLLRFTDHK